MGLIRTQMSTAWKLRILKVIEKDSTKTIARTMELMELELILESKLGKAIVFYGITIQASLGGVRI